MNVLTCLNPTTGWRLRGINPSTGCHYGLLDADQARFYPPSFLEEVAFRCGRCFNCLKYRGSVLMSRCIAEARMHDYNSFITLTFSDDNIEKPECCHGWRSLFHRPFQLFFKRLRKRVRSSGIKFMMCGEYGELSCRPHYHAIIFGVSPYSYYDSGVRRADRTPCCFTRRDNPVFADCWPFGDVFVGSVTDSSIAYVSGYTLKQYVLGRDAVWYADRYLNPEYVKWSRRPGLGASYFDKYDLIDDVDDVRCGVPTQSGNRLFAGRYYLDRLRLTRPEEYDMLLSSYERKSREVEGTPDEFGELLSRRDSRLSCARFRCRNNKRM